MSEAPYDADGRPFLRRLAQAGPRAIGGWFGDLGRLAWGLVSLNARKTAFRRGKGRCPCQNPSDSGKAWETSCDAVMSWSNPARFHRLCPLLKEVPGGAWRCSANAADVRPFWGRAVGWLGGGLAAAFLGSTLAVFAFLRSVGYPVDYSSVAWPPHWGRINQARARYFLEQAQRDLHENKPLVAITALSLSYQLEHNYDVGRMLAQLSQSGWEEISNRIYAQLLADFPAERNRTSEAWFLSLLAHGDFPAIEKLAAARVADDPGRAGAWLNAVLFASRRSGDRTALQKMIEPGSPLPEWIRLICTVELQLRGAGQDERNRILVQHLPPDPAPFLAYYWISRLLLANQPDRAQFELNQHGARLNSHDRIELQLDIYAAEGWNSILESEVDRLLASGVSPELVELLCAQIVRHPDPIAFHKVVAAFNAQHAAVPPDAAHMGTFVSLYCAAGAVGDWTAQTSVAAILKAITGSQFTALDGVEAFFRGGSGAPKVERCLTALPALPIDVSYAMYAFSDLRARSAKPQAP